MHLAENMLADLSAEFVAAMGSQLSKAMLIFDNPNAKRKTSGFGALCSSCAHAWFARL